MNICKNCGKEFEGKRADAQFCSKSCNKRFQRQNVSDNPKNTVIGDKKGDLSATNVSDNVSDTPSGVSDKCENTRGRIKDPLKRITNPKYVTVCGSSHFFYRGDRYEGSYFQSSVYADLMEELRAKPLEQLRAEGYWVPAWKEVALIDRDKYECGCKRERSILCKKHGRM